MIRFLTYLLTIFALLCSCSRSGSPSGENRPAALDTVPTLIMQVQKCSRLYTSEYNISKIVTHDDVVRLKGNVLSKQIDWRLPMGERKVAFRMTARLKAYIDFGGFSEKNIERDGDRITIILPDPVVVMTGSKVDHNSVKEFVALTRSRFSDAEMSAFEQQGRDAIMASAQKMDIAENARENAARVLIPIVEQLGYRQENITVTFRKQFDGRNITIMTGERTTTTTDKKSGR